MGAPAMDEVACARRMKKMYAEWREMRETRFNGATALLVGTGANKEDDLRYLKAVALEVWLFSYELPDTLLMFTDGAIHVVAGGKKAALMENAKEMLKRECGLDLVVYVKPKGEDGTAQAKEILNAIEAEKLVVGMVPKEKNEGMMMASVTAALEAAGTEIKDISSGLAHAMAEKDDKEVTTLKNAVALVSKGLSFAVREMEGAIED